MHKRTPDYQQKMFSLVKSWETSEMKREDFCKAHDLTVHTLSYWRGKYLKAQRSLIDDHPESGDFIAIKPEPQDNMEIHYPNGVFIKVPCQAAAVQLKRLIDLY